MTVAIVDYGSGNLHSAAKAFERAARDHKHEQTILVTRDPEAVRRADRVVLPGVGAFADCRRGLGAIDGMVEALEESVRRSMFTACKVSGSSSFSSRRVPDCEMSIAGQTRRSASLRSRTSSMLPVPLNS